MKLVVDIPDNEYQTLMLESKYITRPIMHIRHGVPLSKVCEDIMSEISEYTKRYVLSMESMGEGHVLWGGYLIAESVVKEIITQYLRKDA